MRQVVLEFHFEALFKKYVYKICAVISFIGMDYYCR